MSEFIGDYLFLIQRCDGQGSHYYNHLAQFLMAKHFNLDLYHQKNYKVPCSKKQLCDYLCFTPIINFVKLKDSYEKRKFPGGLKGTPAHFVELVEKDIISYFRENHKKQFYEVIKKHAEARNYSLPWKDNSKIICINIRLEDMCKRNPITKGRACDKTNVRDYDGTKSFNIVKDKINTKSFKTFNKKKYPALDCQAPIDVKKLEALVTKFKHEYPDKDIYLITYCKTIPSRYKVVIDKYNLKIQHRNQEDYDVWLMMNCDILVTAKSTYSLMAGINHTGSKVYYPYWGTAAALGLGSNFDKSGWIGYV